MELIYRGGTDATGTSLKELQINGEEGVYREDERPLSCLHAGTWASTLMHVCVCERLRKGMSLCQRGGAAPDD